MTCKWTEIGQEQINIKEEQSLSRAREQNRTLGRELTRGVFSSSNNQEAQKKGLVTKTQSEIRDLMLDYGNVTIV